MAYHVDALVPMARSSGKVPAKGPYERKGGQVSECSHAQRQEHRRKEAAKGTNAK
jgi:hypothetical protein